MSKLGLCRNQKGTRFYRKGLFQVWNWSEYDGFPDGIAITDPFYINDPWVEKMESLFLFLRHPFKRA
jgi:hypothetical protein